ncbi:MAG: SURF1 family cytochrome oxidase biogenesis protein, partial [Nitratireductor sp.]
MRFSTFLILACMAGGIAFLSSLGFWQLQRLSWKEDLIAKVESRREAAPISLSEVER